jgi:hypothetical protein
VFYCFKNVDTFYNIEEAAVVDVSPTSVTFAKRFACLHKEALALQVLLAQLKIELQF